MKLEIFKQSPECKLVYMYGLEWGVFIEESAQLVAAFANREDAVQFVKSKEQS